MSFLLSNNYTKNINFQWNINFHYYNSWFSKRSKLTRSMGLEWHVYFLLINLTKVIYLTICQIEHLVKLNKKMTTLVKITNGFLSTSIFGQVEQKKKKILIKMDNGVLVKWDILSQEKILSFSSPTHCDYCLIFLHFNYIWSFYVYKWLIVLINSQYCS